MSDYGYGLWFLVVVNTAIFIGFAVSFFHPHTRRDWKTLGAFSSFVVALNLSARQTATVPVAIAKYAQEHETKYGEMAAGAVLSTLPALLLLLVAQRQIVRGLTAGAVK